MDVRDRQNAGAFAQPGKHGVGPGRTALTPGNHELRTGPQAEPAPRVVVRRVLVREHRDLIAWRCRDVPRRRRPMVLTNPLPGPTMAAARLCLARFARRRTENEIGGTGPPS